MNQPDPFDPATARALDRFVVPPLSSDFADRVVAEALARHSADALPPVMPARHAARRGIWARGRRVLIGVTAFSLMSAAAAATGVFGDAARNVPVIGTLIASVAPAPKPKPQVKPKPKPAAPAFASPSPVATPDVPPVAVNEPGADTILPPAVRRQIRRELVAQRLVDRIERAEALGIKPTPQQRAQVAERLAAMPPQQRVALIRRVREIRRERQIAAGEGGAVQPQARLLSPDERRQFREEWQRLREERRQRRLQRQADGSGDAEPAGETPMSAPPAPEPAPIRPEGN